MHRLVLALLLGTASVGTVVAGVESPVVVQGKSSGQTDATLTSDMQAQESLDEATAAALIGALKSRFEDEDFELRLGTTVSERVSLRDIALRGEARIRFADAKTWLPLRFETLYDTSAMVVESPQITLGAELPKTTADAAKLPLNKLQALLATSLGDTYQSNDVETTLVDARIVDGDGSRYVVQATGHVDFDGNDRVLMTARALYDSKTGRWMDPQFDLEDSGHALAAN